jgi:hypothetical protein
MFDLSQILGPAALYCLRFRSGAWKGTKNGLGFFAEYAWTVGGLVFRMICQRSEAEGSCTMADSLNPAAPHHLPIFITAPGHTDVLMVITGLVLVASVVAFGVLFLRLHTLPERMAHKSQKIQFEIVAVLGLLALFTHIHAFWVAGLLLALIELPDVGSFLSRIAGSVEKIAGAPQPEAEIAAAGKRSAAQLAGPETHERDRRGDRTSTPVPKPESAPARTKEASHA